MKTWFMMSCLSALVLPAPQPPARACRSKSGPMIFNLSVGDYDYLPYAFQGDPGYSPPQINFNDMMSQYGLWVSVSPFGQSGSPMPLQTGVPTPTDTGSTRSTVRIGKAMNPGPGPGITTVPGSLTATMGGSGSRAMTGIRAAWHGRAVMTRLDGCHCLPMDTTIIWED